MPPDLHEMILTHHPLSDNACSDEASFKKNQQQFLDEQAVDIAMAVWAVEKSVVGSLSWDMKGQTV